MGGGPSSLRPMDSDPTMRDLDGREARANSRLFPPRSSDRYHHLTQLKKAFEISIKEWVTGRGYRTLVDLGCGDTPYRPLFEAHVGEYIGVDIPENPGADMSFDHKGRVELASGSVGVVLSTQVLEHVRDTKTYLAEAHRLLSADGVLILSTHGYWMYHPDPHDYWRWTQEGLRELIQQMGFEVVSWRGVMGLMATSLQLLQDGLGPRLPRRLYLPFVRAMQWLMKVADRFDSDESRDRDACVFVLVAKVAG